MEAAPLDLSTGVASATGAIPSITDVGVTLLEHFGLAARPLGYRGNKLEFLVPA
jgi:hypothetical protein